MTKHRAEGDRGRTRITRTQAATATVILLAERDQAERVLQSYLAKLTAEQELFKRGKASEEWHWAREAKKVRAYIADLENIIFTINREADKNASRNKRARRKASRKRTEEKKQLRLPNTDLVEVGEAEER